MIDVEVELEEAGVDLAGATVDIVDKIESPAATMLGCAFSGGYAFLERRAGATAPHDRAVAAALHAVLGELPDDDGVTTALPSVTEAAVAVYRPVPGTSLLAAPLVLARGVDEERWRRLPDDCERLGRYLARLHRLGGRAALPEMLARSTPAMERVRRLMCDDAPQPSAALERLRGLLLVAEPELTDALVARLDTLKPVRSETLLHGQFGSGAVVPAAALPDRSLAVIGWLEAGSGPPAVDLGTFVGELFALESTFRPSDPSRSETLDDASRRFVGGYAESAEDEACDETIAAIGAYSALKIVHQMLLHCTYFGFREDSVTMMAAVARAAYERDWVGNRR